MRKELIDVEEALTAEVIRQSDPRNWYPDGKVPLAANMTDEDMQQFARCTTVAGRLAKMLESVVKCRIAKEGAVSWLVQNGAGASLRATQDKAKNYLEQLAKEENGHTRQ